jgi:hypothetical protein
MRIIKFRAWDKDKKQWISPSWDNDENNISYPFPCKCCVITQYTGLKDTNKKEIYEGDLLKDDGGNIGEVIWNQDDCSFCLDFPHVETQPLDREFSQSMKIIGNIYEKPRKKK